MDVGAEPDRTAAALGRPDSRPPPPAGRVWLAWPGRGALVWAPRGPQSSQRRSDQADHLVNLAHVDALQGQGVPPLVGHAVALEKWTVGISS